eukprot:sb/3472964/
MSFSNPNPAMPFCKAKRHPGGCLGTLRPSCSRARRAIPKSAPFTCSQSSEGPVQCAACSLKIGPNMHGRVPSLLLLLLPAFIAPTQVDITSARASSSDPVGTEQYAIDGDDTTLFHSELGNSEPQWLNLIFATEISRFSNIAVVIENRQWPRYGNAHI